MSAGKSCLVILGILAVLAMFSCLFVVDQTEMAVKTQFGRPVGDAIREPGLYFRIPFIQEIHYFDRRIMEWDGSPNEIPTKDKKFIWVDITARWRIKDPLKFLQTVKDESGGHGRLDDIVDAAARDSISNNNLIDVVRDTDRELLFSEGEKDLTRESVMDLKKSDVGRSMITSTIHKTADMLMPEYGIELIDVKITRINYVDSVQKKVYARMTSERNKIAEKCRSEGEGEKARILGQLEKEKKRIYSEAYRKSQEIKGDADAEATRIYARAFSSDPEFYAFMKTLETYSESIGPESVMVLSTDSELLQLMESSKITK